METEANKIIKQPSYRFAGYTESWEEKKLGEAGETFSGLSGKTKEDFGHGDAKFITYVNIFNNPLATLEGVDKVEIDEKQSQVNFGDVLFTTSSETPEEVGMSSVWLWNEENIYLNSFCFGYRPEKGIFNPYYLAFMLRSFAIRREFMLLAQGISRYNISKKKVMEMPVFLPSLPEQTAIGSLFQDIDQLISLQQCKLEVLKEQKKTYLKLLFPAKGQTKPALRFVGFGDDWKRKNFGDYLVEYNEKTVVENQYELLSSTNNGIEPRIGRVSGESNLGYKVLKKDMIVLSPQNLWLGNINYNSKYDLGIVSPSYKIFNIENVDKKFIAILIRHPYMIYEYGQASVQGASVVRRNLDMDLFRGIQILLPSLEEQSMIGSLFQDIDKTIAKQEEKVNQLKEIKQTLLRKMFI